MEDSAMFKTIQGFQNFVLYSTAFFFLFSAYLCALKVFSDEKNDFTGFTGRFDLGFLLH